MNLWVLFLSALFSFIVTKTNKHWAAYLTLCGLAPMIIMMLFYGIQISTADPATAQAIANKSIESFTNYFGNNIGNWIVEEIFGAIIGAVFSGITGLFK
ncbi:MAG: hypothetical protein JW856_02115 [Dehalococcoidales bacterium]|nr:hypothetical protein [Dehalococcoidales bacterium]